MTAYQQLCDRFARIATIGEAQSMLGWDAAAVMPEGGAEARGDQMAVLAGLAHSLLVAPETAALLGHAQAPQDIWHEANLALMRRAHRRASAIPSDLVEAAERANAACEIVWREARRNSDYAAVRPLLAEVVRLARHQADALAGATGLTPYDALMDGYQPGIGAADVTPVFMRYERFLAEALPLAEELQARRPTPQALPRQVTEAAQEAMCREMSQHAGLDYRHARLDRSTHPFCGGTPTDIRITTRYDEADFAQALMGVMHETGHALYEAGLPRDWRGRQPVGQAAGMAAHESQSLIVEMQACRSDGWLSWLGPKLHAAFGGDAAAYSGANLAAQWRRIARGFIRVDADEMTYPAHVILRFRLEQALIAGTLDVADLPGAWADGMRSLLGIVPPDDARGCLQDIHWYAGSFGYFPSYSLGAMAAAQLMHAGRAQDGMVEPALAQGDFGPLLGWLRAKIHGRASLHGFNDLLREATGAALDPAHFEAHLRRRYLDGAVDPA